MTISKKILYIDITCIMFFISRFTFGAIAGITSDNYRIPTSVLSGGGTTIEMNLPSGWSMISLPVKTHNRTVSSLFPQAVVVYSYERESGYVRVEEDEELQVGDGYWILLNQNQNYTLTGQTIHSYHKTVYEDGWEMIGGCTSGAQPTPDSCDIGVIYRYVQGAGYQRVPESEDLESGEGFWILFNDVLDHCRLTVEGIDSGLYTSLFNCIVRPDRLALYSSATRANMLNKIMDLSYVHGFHIQLFWYHFEPSNNTYITDVIDEVIEVATSRGKSVSLAFVHLWMSPQWLFDSLSDTEKFTFTHPHPNVGEVTSPIPWATNYLTHFHDAVEELAYLYDGVFDYVTVSGPSSVYGIETNFSLLSISDAEKAKLAFTEERYTQEWKNSIDKFFTEFTSSRKGLTLHVQIDLPTRDKNSQIPATLRDYILEKANGDQVVIKLAGLTHDNPNYFPGPFTGFDNESLYTKTTTPARDLENVIMAYETERLFAAGRSPSYVKQLLINGLSYDGNIIEIYREDIWDINNDSPYAPYEAQMAWAGNYGINQKNITHESHGTVSAKNWDSRAGMAANIGIHFCGLAGTSKSLVVNSAASGSYVTKNLNLNISSQRYLRFRLYLDLNSIQMATGDYFRFCYIRNSTNAPVIYVAVRNGAEAGYRIRTVAWHSGIVEEVHETVVTDDEHYLEFFIKRARSSSIHNGLVRVWIDDTLVGSLINLDNYSKFNEASKIELGTIYSDINQGTSGYFKLDEVKIQGHASYIGSRYKE